MALSTSEIADQAAYKWGAVSFFTATAIIISAFAFEHIGGYEPCELCLQQRYSYYIGVPTSLIALILIGLEKHKVAAALFFLVSLIFLANVVLSSYHAGFEWGFWDGPETCRLRHLEPLINPDKGILSFLEDIRESACGFATWRYLGLSFAGWNAIFCIALTISCIKTTYCIKRMIRIR
ncbi:MAG: Disulfide bond formation protein B [Hyphomicrobiaceae bacterium hypho_1]